MFISAFPLLQCSEYMITLPSASASGPIHSCLLPSTWLTSSHRLNNHPIHPWWCCAEKLYLLDITAWVHHLSGPYFHIIFFSSVFICCFSIHSWQLISFWIYFFLFLSLLYQWLVRQCNLLELLLAQRADVHPTKLWVLHFRTLALDCSIYTTVLLSWR